MDTYEDIRRAAAEAVTELIDLAQPTPGSLVVIGCSSSEIVGEKIGTGSSVDAAGAVFDGIYPILKNKGLYLAAQCCEHLNRAIILEEEAAQKYGYDIVNVVPQPKAGGSFATATYKGLDRPCAVETVKASCGMDIGDTLIGMHLKAVAVPVRLTVKKIGCANLVCAKTRPKFIGGIRANYNEDLL